VLAKKLAPQQEFAAILETIAIQIVHCHAPHHSWRQVQRNDSHSATQAVDF